MRKKGIPSPSPPFPHLQCWRESATAVHNEHCNWGRGEKFYFIFDIIPCVFLKHFCPWLSLKKIFLNRASPMHNSHQKLKRVSAGPHNVLLTLPFWKENTATFFHASKPPYFRANKALSFSNTAAIFVFCLLLEIRVTLHQSPKVNKKQIWRPC